MHVIRSLAFYAAFYGGSVYFVLASVIMMHFSIPKMRKICDSWSYHHHWCVQKLLGIRIIESGTKIQGSVLYAIKHESFFEAIAMASLIDNPAGFAKKELFDIPGWGKAARAYGAVEVARAEGAKTLRTMLKEAKALLAENRPLVIFPEGTRVAPGESPPLQAGFAGLYKVLNIPVVPVAVNSGKAYQTLWKRPGEIRIVFGEAIEPGLPRDEIEKRVHSAINVLNTQEVEAGS